MSDLVEPELAGGCQETVLKYVKYEAEETRCRPSLRTIVAEQTGSMMAQPLTQIASSG
jgi:hypothetical protein